MDLDDLKTSDLVSEPANRGHFGYNVISLVFCLKYRRYRLPEDASYYQAGQRESCDKMLLIVMREERGVQTVRRPAAYSPVT
jgi:hypothetical protein